MPRVFNNIFGQTTSDDINTNASISGLLNVTGNTQLGDAAADSLAVAATSIFSGPATFNNTTTLSSLAVSGNSVVGASSDTSTLLMQSQLTTQASSQLVARYTSGNQNDWSSYNSLTQTSGTPSFPNLSFAANTDSLSTNLYLPSGLSVTTSYGKFAIISWTMNISSYNTGNQVLWSINDVSGKTNFIYFFYGSAGKWYLNSTAGAYNEYPLTGTPLNVDLQCHLVLPLINSAASLYINGVLQSTSALGGTGAYWSLMNGNQLTFGKSLTYNAMTNVTIRNWALTLSTTSLAPSNSLAASGCISFGGKSFLGSCPIFQSTGYSLTLIDDGSSGVGRRVQIYPPLPSTRYVVLLNQCLNSSFAMGTYVSAQTSSTFDIRCWTYSTGAANTFVTSVMTMFGAVIYNGAVIASFKLTTTQNVSGNFGTLEQY
jgi:hypothetical protein